MRRSRLLPLWSASSSPRTFSMPPPTGRPAPRRAVRNPRTLKCRRCFRSMKPLTLTLPSNQPSTSSVQPKTAALYEILSGAVCEVWLADIPHIRLRVSKEPAILRDGDGRGIHERRQLSRRAHKPISRCRELASARQRRQLSARLHTLQLIQAHSSPLAILVTSDDPKDTRYPGAGWSPPIRSSTCRNTSRGTATSAS